MSSISVSGSVFEVTAERQDRRVGGVDLGVDRRRRQVGGQQIARRVDRRLHLLLGDVDADIEAEPQRDDRGAGRTLRRHLRERGISPNWRSSGAVTEEVITSGLAPG